MRIASLCLLAYERPELLRQTIRSLHNTDAGYPFELILHDDASTNRETKQLVGVADTNTSFTIQNNGKNMGLAHAMRHCIGCSHGDYIFKLDADLTFKEGWLKKAVDLLELYNHVGAVGLLDYSNYDPGDERFHNKKDMGDHYITDNFVSSAYGFRRGTYENYGHLMGNDGWHKALHREGHDLLITKPDVVVNHGFGKDSIYVSEDGTAVKMHDKPLIFGGVKDD